MDSPREEQKRQILIDFKKEKIYGGTKTQIHYEQFEDTIKYMPYEKWLEFISKAKLIPDNNRTRNILIFKLLCSTGMRIGEFSQIKVSYLNFANNTIDLPFNITKTKKRRIVRVNPELMLDLKEYLQNKNIKSGFVFGNSKRNPYSTRTYQRLFEKYFDKYGLKDILSLDFKPTPHTMRHNHIVFGLQHKIPMPVIMKNVGHKSIKTTQIYSNIAANDVVEAYKEVDF